MTVAAQVAAESEWFQRNACTSATASATAAPSPSSVSRRARLTAPRPPPQLSSDPRAPPPLRTCPSPRTSPSRSRTATAGTRETRATATRRLPTQQAPTNPNSSPKRKSLTLYTSPKWVCHHLVIISRCVGSGARRGHSTLAAS